MNLEERLRELIQGAVHEAVADALDGLELPARSEPKESWRSRLHRVHEDTRLSLDDAGEALGVSGRSVRRYIAGDSDRPALPAQRGPTGLTIRAGDLRTWVEDVEQGERFRQRAAGGGR